MRLMRSIYPALVLLALYLLLGCASDGTHSTVPSAPTEPAGSGPMFVPNPDRVTPAPMAVSRATKLIRANSGGEIATGGMRVQFPAGSLPNDASITLEVETGELVTATLRPAGIVLRSPAILTLDDLTKTDGRGYHGLAFYLMTAAAPVPQPTSNDWRRPQAWVLTMGQYTLGGTRWDIPGLQMIRYLGGSGYKTQLVTRAQGGSVVFDRVRVTIPPNALGLDTYITIRETSENGALAAVLQPHGIQFQAAVTLDINLSGLQWQPYTDWKIYWLNDASGLWENQGGTFQNQKVTGQLWHFSTYAPARGRAGW